MARIAILGGGIAGLAAAFELEKQRRAGKPVDWHLFEASDCFGGTVSTTRLQTPDGEYILEDGPDGWVTEKPWARELAEELGLGGEVIPCNEAEKKTYLWLNDRLVPMPDRMRLMVPEDLGTLAGSALFSETAKRAYAVELQRAEALKAAIPAQDESVAAFVLRHFGREVLSRVAAPLLSGVFGGDVERLSVRAVMPQFVRMEVEYGSLIAALQARARVTAGTERQPTFTSLRRGMGALAEALVAFLPADRLHLGNRAAGVLRSARGEWLVRFSGGGSAGCAVGYVPFDRLMLATPVDGTRALLGPIDPDAASLLPAHASSAVLCTFCWPAAVARSFEVPPGFGFLVPQAQGQGVLAGTSRVRNSGRGAPGMEAGLVPPKLLAGTFTDQKFPGRVPAGARAVRVFFGGSVADQLQGAPDAALAVEALRELSMVLPKLPAPDPALTTVRRWPRSLPQYEVGHLERMADLERRVGALGNLYLLGNGYHGVGVPDLIRDARAAARTLAEGLN